MTEEPKSIGQITCPAPLASRDRVLLEHGGGGRRTAELIRDVFLPAFRNAWLERLDDQAVVTVDGTRLAFTTDSFVVNPLFFPGGDIGSLAVHGTINDLAVGGARPLFLSAAFIIEEGLPIETLHRVVESVRIAAERAEVHIVTGDTKVVERGACDGLFISTSGLGVVPPEVRLSGDQARPGDRVLLSGAIGEHGIAVMAHREGLAFNSPLRSDSAPLHTLVGGILQAAAETRCLRDPTRGGVASALNEIAARSGVGIQIEERAVPVREEVKGACELLGLDPLYVANEGKLIAIVPEASAEAVLAAMRQHPLGRRAAIIGTVNDARAGLVTMRTALGTVRIVDMLTGDQLPRIC